MGENDINVGDGKGMESGKEPGQDLWLKALDIDLKDSSSGPDEPGEPTGLDDKLDSASELGEEEPSEVNRPFKKWVKYLNPLKKIADGEAWKNTAKELWQSVKIRNGRDLATLTLAAVSDIVPWTGVFLGFGNMAAMGLNEYRKYSQSEKILSELLNEFDSLRLYKPDDQEAWEKYDARIVKYGLDRETMDDVYSMDRDFDEVKEGLYKSRKDTLLAPVFQLFDENPEAKLDIKSKSTAAVLGVVTASGGLLLAELTGGVVSLPVVKKVFSRIMYRSIIQFLLPKLIGEGVGVIYQKHLVRKGESSKEAKEMADEWVDLCLGSMSFATVAYTSASMIVNSVFPKIVDEMSEGEVVETETVETATEAPFEAPLEAVATATIEPTMESTETVVPSPEPTEIETEAPVVPEVELNWEPGEVADNNTLEIAEEAGRMLSLNTDSDPETDFRAYWLDDNPGPDVIVDVESGTRYVLGDDNLFHVDFNNDGDLEMDSAYPLWSIDQSMTDLEGVNFNELDSLELDQIVPVGQSIRSKTHGLAAEMATPEMNPLTPPLVDLDGDGHYDIVKNQDGSWFVNRGTDPADLDFDSETDLRLAEQPELMRDHDTTWGIKTMVYEDGQRWERNDEGVMEGYLSDDRRVLMDHNSKGIMGIQYNLNQLHETWTPEEVTIAAARAFSQGLRAADFREIELPEPYSPSSEGQLTFEQMVMGEQGGEVGIVQEAVHEANSSLKPIEVARIAQVVASENSIDVNSVDSFNVITDINQEITRLSFEQVFSDQDNGYGLSGSEVRRAASQASQELAVSGDGIIGKNVGQGVLNALGMDWDEWLRRNGYL